MPRGKMQAWAAPIRFSDDTPEGRMQRFEQGLVDADIEGIKSDPDGKTFVRDLIASGIAGDECVEHIKIYLTARRARNIAAE